MHTVLLGGNVYGVGAAAQFYFGLAPNQLSKITAAQAAMIAAMIQSPNGYSPDPKAGAVRTLYLAVLALLHQGGLIRYQRTRTNGEYVQLAYSPKAVDAVTRLRIELTPSNRDRRSSH
jgi:membrane peptidoglycan carboxypeptidase